MKPVVFYIIFSLLFIVAKAQKKTGNAKPKLVVGIVIDQMRWDYLYRYADRYSENGFKRLMKDGFACDNTFINYTPTYTAPGHSSIYTGSVPAINGIIGNFWYSRILNRNVYCTEDSTVKTIGSNSDAGKMSPANMWTTTITDELRLASNMKSKVIGIALKDRGAILPAGHTGNAAYWFDNANGAFITSSYYMKELPLWVKKFNDKKLPEQYLQQNWNTLYPLNTYSQSTEDDKMYESSFPGEDRTFPHITAAITKDKYNALRYTPYGNTLTFDMAKAAIEGEGLGQSGNLDFLAISVSSTDYIGHSFGPNSIENEDTYLRLDDELGKFLTYLDSKMGEGYYTVFLTADHGVANVPGFVKEHHISAGSVSDSSLKLMIDAKLEKHFKIKRGVDRVINYQVYLNKQTGIEEAALKKAVIEVLSEHPAVASVVDVKELMTTPLPEKIRSMIINGYNQKLSGDIQFILMPQWLDGFTKGTTHGAWYAYDAHIPLLWYGNSINNGKTHKEVYMTDIAATLAALLHIQMPGGCIGKVIEEVIK